VNISKLINIDAGAFIAKPVAKSLRIGRSMAEVNLMTEQKTDARVCVEERVVYSEFLERDVTIDVYLPTRKTAKEIPLLLINDGQDLRTMDFRTMLDALIEADQLEPIVCVGIHCGEGRMDEYGTACCADYLGRGAKAGLYHKFIFDELLPFIEKEFKQYCFQETSFAGFSLGGLSALDIVWNHAHEFSKVGVFSGSLWWRRRGYEDERYDWDKDRIMHLQVQKGRHFDWLKFFFECGQLDETEDRNNNGVIDSIDDVRELIEDMKGVGYKDDQIYYLELEDGEHNVETWARAFPIFLRWGWGRNKG
jgi:enterochelin esterase-like enzyme